MREFDSTPLGRDLVAEERDFFAAIRARDEMNADGTSRSRGKPRPMRTRRSEHRPGIPATKRTGG